MPAPCAPPLINLRLPLLLLLAVARASPLVASEVDYLRAIVPSLGDHALRIVSPTLLEVKRLNSKPPAPAPVDSWDFVNAGGALVAPAASKFVVKIAGVPVGVTAVGFRRRPFYAPLRARDLRIDNSLYLQLAAPVAPGQTVVVTNPDGLLWSSSEDYAATADPLRYSPAIHVNQEGYVPGLPKQAMIGYYLGSLGELAVASVSGFTLVDTATGATVFTGPLTARPDVGYVSLPTPYQNVLAADFSAFTTAGTYRLAVPGLGASLPFAIDEGLAMGWLRTYALGLYHQRCGTDNVLPFTRFVHDVCHVAPAAVPSPQSSFGFTWSTIASKNADYATNPRHTAPRLASEAAQLYPFVNLGLVDVSGGHHDAGDYSKYTINSAMLAHLLMFTADAIPGAAALDNLGLPESGDALSDIMQEAKREADYLARLQDADGGFYFIVYPKTREYESNTLPAPGDAQVVWPKNTAATAAAVAALAQCASSPRFKQTYPAVAALYLQKAVLGWQFLLNAIAQHGKDGAYQKITFYGDNYMHDDELAWAACELFLATGEAQYAAKLAEFFPDPSDSNTFRWGWWRMSEGWGNAIRSYAFAARTGRLPANALNPAYLAACEAQIVAAGDDALRWSNQNAYASSFPEETKHVASAGWYFSLDQASDMAVAYQIVPKAAYLAALVGNMNYEGGTNPVNATYVTGLGQKRVRETVNQYAQNDRRVLPPDGIPLGNIHSNFDYLSPYGSLIFGNELSALVYPPDGATTGAYPMYDRWADTFNVTTEFITVNQARSLLSVAVLATRTTAQAAAWTSGTAQIITPAGVSPLDLPVTLTVQAPGFNLTGARVTWEARDQEPGVDTAYTFSPKNNGTQWVEAEIQWPDGRRIFTTAAFAANSTVVNWVNGAVPAGATSYADGGDAWTWVPLVPPTPSGLPAHQTNLTTGIHLHWFDHATATMDVAVGDRLFAWIYLDPVNPPTEVMLSWNDGSEEHRAYWGANTILWGFDGTPGRQFQGALPTPGQWTRLTVSASAVGLVGSTVKGMGFTLVGGRASWDTAGLLAAPTTAPIVTTQPQPQTVTAGASVTFTVVASGTLPLSYQWSQTGAPLAGATNAALTLTNVQAANAGSYTVRVTNSVGSATSDAALLTVTAAAPLPIFLLQPQSQAIAVGQPAGFTVTVSGTPTPTLQWRKSGTALSGATSPTFTIASVQTSSAGNYDCVATNPAGTAISAVAVLSVSPAVTTPPLTQSVNAGANVTLIVAADGTPPLSYQWKRNGRPLAGATSAAYAIVGAAPLRDRGWYQAVVTNGAGSATSAVAFVSVATSPGQIIAWGANASGQLTVPAALTAVVALAGGGAHSVALKSDGTVAAWGANGFGQSSPQGALTAVVGIGAGINHTVALKANGTVAAWGDDTYGQCQVPPGLANVVRVAAGNYHSIALKADGTVVAWGDNSSGQTAVPAGLLNVVDVAGGGAHSVALKADGTVAAWGYNGSGQISVPAGLGSVTHLAAGYNHTLALKADGTVVAWGWNGHGQIIVPAGLNAVVAVAAGDAHSLALKADGTVVAWGENSAGQTTPPVGLSLGVGLAAGAGHSLVLRNAAAGTMPTITTPPANLTAAAGQPATFSVVAAGTPAPTYQWRKAGVALAGATASTLSFAAAQSSDAGTYVVVVSNSVSSITSSAATLTVNFAPIITTQPSARAVNLGQPASFTVAATGFPTPTFQWRKNVAAIAGATGTTFSIAAVTNADPGNYDVVLTNSIGTTTSNAASLTLYQSPAITAQPLGRPIASGETAALGVTATGTAPLAYQWYQGTSPGTATPLGGATLATFTTPALTATTSYWVRVTNPAGSADSTTATIAIAAFVPTVTLTGESGSQYSTAGGTATLRVRITYTGQTPANIGVSLALPAGWTFGSHSGASATAQPSPGASSLQWTFATFPAGELTFTFTANFPAGQSGDKSVNGSVNYLPGPVDVPFAALVFTPISPPTITTPPAGKLVAIGTGTTFTVAATGTGTLGYQWRKDGGALTDGGRISGATTATLSLAGLALADAGSYTVVVTNAADAVTSSAALLTVIDAHATHAVIGAGYAAGGSVTVTQTLTHAGPGTGLGWQMLLPAGWAYVSGGGAEGDTKPIAGTISLLAWTWTTLPTGSVTFTVTLSVPPAQTGDKTIASLANFRVTAGAADILVTPDPLTLSQVTPHSADTDRNLRIGLFELTRVIELYNTRNGTNRTGCYAVATTTTEDGFAPEPTRSSTATVTLALYHGADSDRNGKLGLLELTRVIELYNTRSGTNRTGAYHPQAGTEDGYAPGP